MGSLKVILCLIVIAYYLSHCDCTTTVEPACITKLAGECHSCVDLDCVLFDQLEYVPQNIAGYAQYPVMNVRQADARQEKNLACYGNKQD